MGKLEGLFLIIVSSLAVEYCSMVATIMVRTLAMTYSADVFNVNHPSGNRLSFRQLHMAPQSCRDEGLRCPGMATGSPDVTQSVSSTVPPVFKIVHHGGVAAGAKPIQRGN
jgi:hypothetical protein